MARFGLRQISTKIEKAMRQKWLLLALWSALSLILFPLNEVMASSLAVIMGDGSGAYEKRFVNGVRQAGIDLRADVRFYQYTSAGDGDFIKLLKTIDNTNPQGILIEVRAPSNIDLLIKEAGLKARVVLANFRSSFEPRVPFVTWDEKHTGAVAAESFATAFENSKGKIGGDVLLIKPENSGPIIDDRVEGFRNQLATYYPKITVVTKEVTPYNADKTIADSLTSEPYITGVFAPDFSITPDLAETVSKYAKLRGIKVVSPSSENWSTFSDSVNVPVLADTDFVIQDPYALGYQSVYRVLNEEPAGQKTASYVPAATIVPGANFKDNFQDWGLVAGPGLSDDDQILHILYATNRTLTNSDKQSFSGELDKETHYGIAYVRVPEHHLFGHLEITPQWDSSQATIFMLKRRQGVSVDRFKSTITSSTVKTAVIFIHGFNSSFDDSLFRFAQIIWDGQLRDMIPVLFSWPSNGAVRSYIYDGENAINSVDALEKLLLFLQTDCKIDNINIIAHSMGNRVVVPALTELSKHHEIDPIGELILAAADLNTTEFSQNATS